MDGSILCPHCLVSMDFGSEVETLKGGERRITRFFKCPACRNRVLFARLTIRSSESGIELIVSRV